MGSLLGHTVPGSFFFIIGLWHTVHIFLKYYKSKRTKQEFINSTWNLCVCCCCSSLKQFPLEAAMKILMASCGILIEAMAADYKDGKFHDPMNEQHMTMYFAFGLSGILDILTYYGLTFSPFISHIGIAFAYFVEYVLFSFHLHGRENLDVVLHTMLLYVIAASIVSVICMMKYENNLLVGVMYCFCDLLQGTWFWQIGFILYNPLPNSVTWNLDDHGNIMLASCYFSWHCLLIMSCLVLIGSIFSVFYRKNYEFVEEKDTMSSKSLLHSELCSEMGNGQTLVLLNNESDDE